MTAFTRTILLSAATPHGGSYAGEHPLAAPRALDSSLAVTGPPSRHAASGLD